MTAAVPDNPRHNVRLLLVLTGCAALLRFVLLGAFPDIVADEGLWTNSSKNYVAFGDWFMDGRTHMLLSPVFHWLSVVVFELFHPSIAGARAISALAGVASMLLLYLLTCRISGRQDFATITAIVFGFDAVSVLQSRLALIESLELCVCLAAAVLLVQRWRGATVAAGVLFGVALLTKVNAGFLLPVLVGFLFLRLAQAPDRDTLTPVREAGVFAVVSLLVAGAVYGVLYQTFPQQFIPAFKFQLDGVHFEGISHPIVRLGRFGLDPVQASRTIIALFRDSPFLMVLAVCGAGLSVVARPRGVELFGPWLIVGVGFFLCQMFQPVRYFYLVIPAFAFFAAVAIDRLAAGEFSGATLNRRMTIVVVGLYLVFNLGYVGMGAVANRGTKLQQVVQWVRANTQPTDRIMAAGYFCTDLPNRCYAHYLLARDMSQLTESIRKYQIDYVIFDSGEWHHDLGDSLAQHFAPVERWGFGTVYGVTPRPISSEEQPRPRHVARRAVPKITEPGPTR